MTNIEIELDVEARMRDGVVLRADIYRPKGGGPWPVLLSRLPYSKRLVNPWTDPVRFAEKGFIVVVQDTRGRFASEGDWEPWTFESDDGYDTVRWASSLPGANGAVGMIGASYFGNTQWMAALSQAPGLRAIAPMLTWSDPDDGLFSRGGAAELGIALAWSLAQGVDAVQKRYATDPEAMGAAVVDLIADFDAMSTDGYWRTPVDRHPTIAKHGIPELGFERSRREPGWTAAARVSGRQKEVDLPSLQFGGWYDIFLQGTLDNFAAIAPRGDSHLVVGPWHHLDSGNQIGDVNFGLAASTDVLGLRGHFVDLQARWFKQHLDQECEADAAGLSPVLLFVMGINEWREEQEWPLARAEDVDLHLRADATASFEASRSDEGVSRFVYDPSDPVMTVGGSLLMSSEFRPGPLNQAPVEEREDVLVFTSDVLTSDLEVTGRVKATINVSSDVPTTDWVVRLCDVDTRGISRNVVDGIRRMEMAPGAVTEVEIDLWSTSHVFRAGHRLRVQVTSSNFPRWDRNFNNVGNVEAQSAIAHQVVIHEAAHPSRVVLPVVPARAE